MLGSSEPAGRPTAEEFRAKDLCGVDEFKDASCGYQGCEQWCDRSRAMCQKLGNIARFDGALPDIQEPFDLPWIDITLALAISGVMVWSPTWTVAGPLYMIFFLLLLPPIREALYWKYMHPPVQDEEDEDVPPHHYATPGDKDFWDSDGNLLSKNTDKGD